MRWLIVLSLFASSVVWADCPDLKGLYRVCKRQDGVIRKVLIRQKQKDGATVYTIAWSEERTEILIADGVTRVTPVFDTGMEIHLTATCDEENVLHKSMQMVGSNVAFDEKYWFDNNQLRFESRDAGGVIEDIVCKRP